MDECEPESFDWNYDDRRECRDDLEDVWQAKRSSFDALACTYDPEVGKACIHAMYERRKKCEPEAGEVIREECRLIFDCFP